MFPDTYCRNLVFTAGITVSACSELTEATEAPTSAPYSIGEGVVEPNRFLTTTQVCSDLRFVRRSAACVTNARLLGMSETVNSWSCRVFNDSDEPQTLRVFLECVAPDI